MRKYFPIILGVFLGAVSIIMGQVHIAIAQFSGMTVIGHNEGYLLGALIVVWLYWDGWRKSFLVSFCYLFAANITYYACILVFYFTGLGRSPFPPSPLDTLFSFTLWTIIMAIVCALAATAVWLARFAKSRLLNYGIFAVSYLGLLGVIYSNRVNFLMMWHESTMARDGHVVAWRLVGYVFEIVFAVVLTTVVLGVGLRRRLKNGS